MFDVVLYEPEIPPNTGNIIRLCANTGTRLHLIEPLGFDLDDRALKRAGLDYHEYCELTVHPSYSACISALNPTMLFAFSTRASGSFATTTIPPGSVLLFGSETSGLPDAILDSIDPARCLRIPMHPGSRSLNLSNAVAIAVFNAWRQHDYAGSSELARD